MTDQNSPFTNDNPSAQNNQVTHVFPEQQAPTTESIPVTHEQQPSPQESAQSPEPSQPIFSQNSPTFSQRFPSDIQPSQPFTPPVHIPPTIDPPADDFEEKGLFTPIKIILGLVVIFFVIVSFIFVISKILSHNGASAKAHLVYWGLWEDSSIMQPIIDDFERENPNITIDYVKQDPKQYSTRLLTRIPNGTGPDIFRFHDSWVPMLSSDLAPLTQDAITPKEFSSTFYPVMSQDLIKNGAIYGIPLEIDTLSLFVNTDLLQKTNLKVPNNWPDFITVSRALTEKDANGKIITAGAALGTYANITHAPDIVSLLFAQNGANSTSLATTAVNASDALTFYSSFTQGDGNVWDGTLDPSLTAFSEGKLGMYFGYSWDLLTLKALNPSIHLSVSPVPHLPGRNMTIASYWVEGVSNKSKYPKQAMLFMKFLAQKDTEEKLYTLETKERSFGEPYARVDLGSSLGDSPLSPFIAQAKTAVSSIFVGETQDDNFNASLNTYLQKAVESVPTGTSPQTAITTLTQGVSQVLQQYGFK